MSRRDTSVEKRLSGYAALALKRIKNVACARRCQASSGDARRRAPHHEGLTARPPLNRRVAQRAAQAVHDESAVAVGEHALEVGGVDLHIGKTWPAGDVLHGLAEGLDFAKRRDRSAVRNA